MTTLRAPPSTSCLTSAKNGARFGYVSLGSFTLTILTSPLSATASCITSPPGLEPRRAPRASSAAFRLLRTQQQPRQLLPAPVDPALHRALREVELVGHLLIAEPLQVAKHDRLPQLRGQRLEAAAQEAAPVPVLQRAVGVAAGRGGGEVEGDEVLHEHLALPLAGPVVVDAVVPGHAAQPRREIRVAVELVQAAEHL